MRSLGTAAADRLRSDSAVLLSFYSLCRRFEAAQLLLNVDGKVTYLEDTIEDTAFVAFNKYKVV